MGLWGSVKRAVKKVTRVVTGRGSHGQSAPEAPTPAPEIELSKVEGEAEKKEETEKKVRRKGKKALKISKSETPSVSSGRNII